MFERVKRTVEISVEAIMITWIVLSFFLLVIWVSLEYQELQNQKVVDSGYPFKSDQELACVKKKFGENCLQINKNNEWVAYVNGETWRAFPEDKEKK